jgi:hypothetical protein
MEHDFRFMERALKTRPNDYDLVCAVDDNSNGNSVCCHGQDGGYGGGCGVGAIGCCDNMDCDLSTHQCIYDVGWTTAQQFAYAITNAENAQARFNYVQETMPVPPPPPNPADAIQQTIWIGVSGTSNSAPLLQAALWYHGTMNGGSASYTLQPQYFVPKGFVGPGCSWTVSPNDQLLTILEIVEPDDQGDGDYWKISMTDVTQDPTQTCSITMSSGVKGGTGPSNPAMNVVYVGVLEVQGLLACDGLLTPSDPISIEAVYQEANGSNGWDHYVNATPDLTFQTGTPNEGPGPQPPGPACNYQSTTLPNDNVVLSWDN